jgi:hypothetical protein
MSLPLAKYCACWFVKKRLGVSNDTDPPRDQPLVDIDRLTLAGHLVEDIKDAELVAGMDRVHLDADAIAAASPAWRTVFDAADSMLAYTRQDDAHQPAPKALMLAFTDYLITRWIFREVWRFEARRRPTDREFPPPFRNADARRGLADALASNCRRVDVQLKHPEKFANASARWRWLSDARTALINQLVGILALTLCATAAEAQLTDPGSDERLVGVFFQKGKSDEWRGGIVSRGDQKLETHGRMKFTWQLDYGSTGGEQVTPSGTTTSREADVSKNSGVYTVSYVRVFHSAWRVTGDAGLEHKRLLNGGSREDVASALVNGSIRSIGSRLLGADADRAPELAWSLQTNISTTEVIATTAESREVFFDPVAVLWLSFLPGRIPREPDQQPRMFYRVQVRAEGAAMQPFDGNIDAQAHWDGSVVFFFTPANGLMLRRFSGFFDHNLRDRKDATTLNLLWKF